MAIFRCKICGGTLEFSGESLVCECQYCGTKQTLPKSLNEHSNTLYERADHFRRNNDFDKAISIYEQILNADNTDAEAYWSLVLCRYGVEYVEDPKNNKRIATVNRMQYTSVLADEDYKSAVKYADASQKEIYEAEAKEIDSIQKGILAISQREEPFDVFICYKETDNNGRRTPDSVLANELYHQLSNEGFKVFFSRITLEDKLGTAYEPYIFAALNSAKVMVVIGTKPDYFNAVWVKNEWSRYLSLIKNGANKVLIPAYRDMDPYYLPEEFSNLQAQDMSKLGFMQDLIRGIEKITGASRPKYEKEQPVQSGGNISPLLRRVFLFLEDGDWDSANEYCEKVLDLEPECAGAYLGKLMVQMRVRRREKLGEQTESFENNPNYQKAIRFGDTKLQGELEGYIKNISNRAERNRLATIYLKGEAILRSAKSAEDYMNAAKIFAQIIGFEDSEARVKECEEKAKEMHFSGLYSAAVALMKEAKNEEDFVKAQRAFEDIKEYKDSEKLAKECAGKAENINKDAIYTAAIALITGNKANNYKKAIAEFEKIRGFKDADQKIEYCNGKIERINEAVSLAEHEKQNHAQKRAEVLKEKLSSVKKMALIVAPVLVVAIICVAVLPKIEWNKNSIIDSSSNETSLNDSSENVVVSSEISSKPQNAIESVSMSSKNEPSKIESDLVTSKKTSSSRPVKPSSSMSVVNPDYDGREITSNGNYRMSYNPHSKSFNTEDANILFNVQISDGKVSIKGAELLVVENYGECLISIPSKIAGYPVTKIETQLSSKINYENIPNMVFPYMNSESIPNTMEIIGEGAFSGMSAHIYDMTLSGNVQRIEARAFSDFYLPGALTISEGTTYIGEFAFQNSSEITSVSIPDSIVEIGESAFEGCTALNTVYFKSEAQKEKFKDVFPSGAELIVQ